MSKPFPPQKENNPLYLKPLLIEKQKVPIFLFSSFCTQWLHNGLLNSLSKHRHFYLYPTDTNSELARKAMEVR